MSKGTIAPIEITDERIKDIRMHITNVESCGRNIRKLIAAPLDPPHGLSWEVAAAIEVLEPLGQRWNIEICAALYIGGANRFNELRTLLHGISSRTLSDKLRSLTEKGFVHRSVDEGPPIRVNYTLTAHGEIVGRLLGPLVAYLKIESGLIRA